MKHEQQRQKGREVLPSYSLLRSGPPRKLTAGMLRRMNIPEDYWRVTLEGVGPDETRDIVTKYLVNIAGALSQGIGMVINGEYGSGKTSIAILCLKQARRLGGTGLYLTAPEYLRDVFRGVMYDDTLTVERRSAEVDLLVIDDLGKEAVNIMSEKDASAAMFVALMKERASSSKSTIITSNLTIDMIEKLYGKAFRESIREKSPMLTASCVKRTNEAVKNFFEGN